MIEIQIKEEKYEIPTEWKDITLEYWCGLYNIIKKYTETAEDGENKENVEPKVDEVKVLRMNKEIFKYVTGVNDAMLNQLDLESVNTAVGTIGQMMEDAGHHKYGKLQLFEWCGSPCRDRSLANLRSPCLHTGTFSLRHGELKHWQRSSDSTNI